MSQTIENLIVKMPASLTVEGVKEPISIAFDFTGMTIKDIAAIAAKDLVTDIQNNVRPNAQDSPERKKAKIAKMKEIVKESRDTGKFSVIVAERAKRLAISSVSIEDMVAQADDAELVRLQELLDAAKRARATKK